MLVSDRCGAQSTERRPCRLSNKTGELLTTDDELDPRVRRTRQLIEDAFLELLGERTLRALTVGEITRRAGINRATFYSHFYDKYALFSNTVRKTFQRTLNQYLPTGAQLSPTNMQALVAAVCHYFVYLNSQCPPSDRELRPVAETEVQAVVNEQILAWLRADPDRDDPDLTAAFLSWAIFGAGLEWVGNRAAPDADDIARRMVVLVETTLATARAPAHTGFQPAERDDDDPAQMI